MKYGNNASCKLVEFVRERWGNVWLNFRSWVYCGSLMPSSWLQIIVVPFLRFQICCGRSVREITPQTREICNFCGTAWVRKWRLSLLILWVLCKNFCGFKLWCWKLWKLWILAIFLTYELSGSWKFSVVEKFPKGMSFQV